MPERSPSAVWLMRASSRSAEALADLPVNVGGFTVDFTVTGRASDAFLALERGRGMAVLLVILPKTVRAGPPLCQAQLRRRLCSPPVQSGAAPSRPAFLWPRA